MPDPINTEGLAGLLRRLGGINMSTFGGRLCLQKKVYLTQAFGAPIGYDFNWYVRGPYSPPLTRAGFEMVEKFRDSPPMKFSDPEVERRFNDAITFMRGRTGDPRWLEVVASIHFLSVVVKIRNKEAIYATIREKMPSVSQAELDRGWDDIVRAKLIKVD